MTLWNNSISTWKLDWRAVYNADANFITSRITDAVVPLTDNWYIFNVSFLPCTVNSATKHQTQSSSMVRQFNSQPQPETPLAQSLSYIHRFNDSLQWTCNTCNTDCNLSKWECPATIRRLSAVQHQRTETEINCRYPAQVLRLSLPNICVYVWTQTSNSTADNEASGQLKKVSANDHIYKH